MIEIQGIASDPMAEIVARRFAGTASDGRPLRSLLELPETDAQFEMIVRTQLQDVGRSAAAVAAVVEPKVTGYVRVLSLPSCGRCAILAGRFYRWNAGFQRHPRCDCRHLPSSERIGRRFVTSPRDAFEAMSTSERTKAFTRAGSEAISLGADPERVVNVRRGMSTATVFGRDVKVTTEAARGRRVRLMPESILELAAGDKEEAVRLLRVHGYVQ